MKRLLLLFALICVDPLLAFGQTTTVSGTVQDSSGIAYSFGNFTVSLVNNTGQQPTFGGSATFQQTYAGGLDTNGAFSLSLPQSTAISPSGTTWNFFICANPKQYAAAFPQPANPVCFNTGGISITGTSQSITTQINAAVVTIPKVSGSSSASSSGPGDFVLSPNCPAGNANNCFQTPWNTKEVVTCSWTLNSTLVTCASGPFVVGDVGKRIAGWGTCVSTTLSNATLGSQAGTTIASYVSATQINVSNNATATQAATATNCIAYGSPDDTALSAIDTAAQASVTCPKIRLPPGMGTAVNPHFFINPPACLNLPEELGGTVEFFGFLVEGAGAYQSQLWLPPDFPLASCTHGSTGHACFGGFQLYFRDWSLQGFGNPGSGSATVANLLELGTNVGVSKYSRLERFNVNNFGQTDTSLTCVEQAPNAFRSTLISTNIESCGNVGLNVDSQIELQGSSVEGSARLQIQVASGALIVIDGLGEPVIIDGQGATDATGAVIFNNGGTVTLNGVFVDEGTTGGQPYGYRGVGGTLNSNASIIGAAGQNAVFLQSSATANLLNSTITSGALSIFDTGSKVFDKCGNTVTTVNNTGPGTIFGNCSIIGTKPAAGNIALGAGYGTSTLGSFNGTDQKHFNFTITLAGTQTQATSTITYTFPTAFWSAPGSCRASWIGGTQAALNFSTSTLPTTTSVVFTAQTAGTAGNTEIVAIDCQ